MNKKLFIALPVYRELDAHFTQCLLKLIANPPMPIMLRMLPGDSLVSRARNSLTADFLASDCTHLLWIDTDLIFSPDHVARLASHDEDLVGGFYPKKQEGPLSWVLNTLVPPVPPREDGLQELRYIGTGFMCIARTVFSQMIHAHPELAYTPDHRKDRTEHDFWSVGVYRTRSSPREPWVGRYLSEDWYFCQRWLDLGGRIFGDTHVVLKHVGQAIYPLSYQEPQISGSVGLTHKATEPSGEAGLRPAPSPQSPGVRPSSAAATPEPTSTP
jgi:hypothetical protein